MTQQRGFYENLLQNFKDGGGGYLNSATKNMSKLNANMSDENQIFIEAQSFLNEMNLAKADYKLDSTNPIQ